MEGRDCLRIKPWLVYAIITTVFWGVWGAFIDAPAKAGFQATLGYCVWALTMIPCALVALKIVGWKLEYDKRSVWLGCIIGFTGAGGQLILFEALRLGPAYLIFPIISVSPVVTILLSCWLLKERASARSWWAIGLAMVGIVLLSYSPPDQPVTKGVLWVVLALVVFLAWGIQAYFWKLANATMKAESIFFYMAATTLVLIPVALYMTDFSKEIPWHSKWPWLAALIQVLNSIGALCVVYAFRYGKAIIVSPLTNAVGPVITVLISLALYRVIPHPVVVTGMVFSIIAMLLIALEPEKPVEAAAAAVIPPSAGRPGAPPAFPSA
jgi:drug/metabolite transporter (DMT)-like permease